MNVDLGWVDNVNGPTGLILGCGKGVIRTILCVEGMVADLVPVDVPINMMIAVAWYTAVHRPNNIVVYNCTSGSVNTLLWGDLRNVCQASLRKNPLNDVVWYPDSVFRGCRVYNVLVAFVLHSLPAHMADIVAFFSGRKRMYVRMHSKIQKALACLEYFTTHEWKFENNNMWLLLNAMPEDERKVFNFDMRTLHWPTYLENYCLGTKLYVMKEDLTTLSTARKHLRRMYILRWLTFLAGCAIMWRLLMIRFKLARQTWYFLLSMAIRLAKIFPQVPWS